MDLQSSVRRAPPRLMPSRGSLAALYQSLNLEPPPERNLRIFDHIPIAHDVCAVVDDRMAPLIRAGEVVVFDKDDFMPESDVLFVIEYRTPQIGGLRSSPPARQVVELLRTEFRGRESWWLIPAFRPLSDADRDRLIAQKVSASSEGPLSRHDLDARIIGRAIGLYRTAEDGNAHV